MLSYTKAVASHPTKKESRKKIATDIKRNKTKKVIHYLGGVHPSTPFENKFSNKANYFIRYEKNPCPTPKNYCRLTETQAGEIIHTERNEKTKGLFLNGDFFFWFDITGKTTLPQYLWLDFCGMPTPELLFELYTAVFNGKNVESIKDVYVTFFLNPRNRTDVAEYLTKYGYGIEDKAKSLVEHIKNIYTTDESPFNFSCEIFDTYYNDRAPMCVLKFKNLMKTKTKTTKTMKAPKNKTKKTMQDYVNLSKRFTNKQIAIFWRMGTMQIAGYEASAKRCGLIPVTTINA